MNSPIRYFILSLMAVGTALNSYAEAVHAANALGADSLLGERPYPAEYMKARLRVEQCPLALIIALVG